MTNNAFRVAVIGLGSMGKNHFRVLKSMSSVSELICLDEKPNQDSAFFANAMIAKDLEEVIKANPDYAVVATPSSTHEQVAIALAQFGVPSLIEKPIAHSAMSEANILSAFRESKTPAFAGFVERFSGVNLALRELLDSGSVGQPLVVDTERIGPNPNRVSDVGVLLDLGSHDVDLVQWLFREELFVDSLIETKSETIKSAATTVSLHGLLGDSVGLRSLVSWDSPVKRRRIRVLGSKGMITADALQGTLSILRMDNSSSEWENYRHIRGYFDSREERIFVSQREPLVGEHEAMQSFLADGNSMPCTLEEAVKHMKPVWRFKD